MSRDDRQPAEKMWQNKGEDFVKHALSAIFTEMPEHKEQPEDFYRLLFEMIDQGFICRNAAGQIIMANVAAQNLLGLTFEEMHGLTSLESSLQPIREDGSPFPGAIHPAAVALHTGETVSDVVMGIFHPGEGAYRWLNVSAFPLCRAGETTPFRVFTVFHDQTELKRTRKVLDATLTMMDTLTRQQSETTHERDSAMTALKCAHEEIERMQRIKSNFVSLMSHEFRSALTSIQSSSELMSNNDLSVGEMKEFALDIYADARRMIHMISDMLELSSMVTRRLSLNWEWLDLNAIIADAASHCEQTTLLHHFIHLNLAHALPILKGDREKLIQLVTHLLTNAIQHSPDGGEIVVSSIVEGSVVHVSVCDHGPGISALALERIFEDRVDKTAQQYTKPAHDLPAMREIVHTHGGDIWAESSIGAGSIFHFTIPFTETH